MLKASPKNNSHDIPNVRQIRRPLKIFRHGVKIDKKSAEHQYRNGCYWTQENSRLQSKQSTMKQSTKTMAGRNNRQQQCHK